MLHVSLSLKKGKIWVDVSKVSETITICGAKSDYKLSWYFCIKDIILFKSNVSRNTEQDHCIVLILLDCIVIVLLLVEEKWLNDEAISKNMGSNAVTKIPPAQSVVFLLQDKISGMNSSGKTGVSLFSWFTHNLNMRIKKKNEVT